MIVISAKNVITKKMIDKFLVWGRIPIKRSYMTWHTKIKPTIK